jgi:hypothetical protein
VLIALRDFQDDKCDVILKYFPEEVKQLKNLKEIPEVLVENNILRILLLMKKKIMEESMLILKMHKSQIQVQRKK